MIKVLVICVGLVCIGLVPIQERSYAQEQKCTNQSLTPQMQKAYSQLKKDGFDISVRCYKKGYIHEYIHGYQSRINYERGK